MVSVKQRESYCKLSICACVLIIIDSVDINTENMLVSYNTNSFDDLITNTVISNS